MARYALVIGIGENRSPLRSLSKPVGDAGAIAHILGSVHKIGSDQPEILIISLIFWDLHKNLNAPQPEEVEQWLMQQWQSA